MNIYNFDVNFTTGRIYGPDLLLVVNDHNSTTFKFTFDQEGRYVFKLLYPDNTIYVQDIINGELVLTKGILNQEGNYKFEISLYGDDNRLTTARIKEFPVRHELVETDEPVQADDRLPILDNLIEETNKVVEAAKNGEFDGATFTPSVSDNGDLSWTNDKGKENPPTVNIKGAKGDPGAVKMQVVDTLPQVGDTDTIYLLKKDTPDEQNLYDEYVYTEASGWEHIGDTSVDLTDYYTKEETEEKLNNKQDALTPGDNITIENNVISASGGTPTLYLYPDTSTYSMNGFNKVYHQGDTIFDEFKTFYDSKNDLNWAIQVVFTPRFTGDNGNVVCYPTAQPNITKEDYVSKKIAVDWASNTIYLESSLHNDGIAFTVVVNAGLDNDKNITYVSIYTKSLPYLPMTTTDNSTVMKYTPTSDYNPATKKYVDDNKYTLPIASNETLGGIKLGENLNIDENGVVSASNGNSNENLDIYNIYTEISIDGGEYAPRPQGTDKELTDTYNAFEELINKLYVDGKKSFGVILHNKKWNLPLINYDIARSVMHVPTLQDKPTSIQLTTPYLTIYSIDGINTDTSAILGMAKLNISLLWDNDICTVSSVKYNWAQINVYNTTQVLSKINTTAYTPTSNYHPATKKYVDDSIAAASSIPIYDFKMTSPFTKYNPPTTYTYMTSTDKTTLQNIIQSAYDKGLESVVLIARQKYGTYTGTNEQTQDYLLTTVNNSKNIIKNKPTALMLDGYNHGSMTMSDNHLSRLSILFTLKWSGDTCTVGQAQYINKDITIATQTDYQTYAGYDATKTQVLKNVNGTLTWQNE